RRRARAREPARRRARPGAAGRGRLRRQPVAARHARRSARRRVRRRAALLRGAHLLRPALRRLRAPLLRGAVGDAATGGALPLASVAAGARNRSRRHRTASLAGTRLGTRAYDARVGAVLDAQAERELERLAELLGRGARTLVLTGAGVSTESGLPDYRGANGLWRNRRFEELASIEAWRAEPEEFWSFYRERLAALRSAEPNAGHLAIAELERRGLVHRVITQNVDGLHRRAGSAAPLEVHGTLAELECLGCGWRGPSRL